MVVWIVVVVMVVVVVVWVFIAALMSVNLVVSHFALTHLSIMSSKICRCLKHVQGSSIPLGSGSIMMPWKPCRKRYCPWKKSDLLIAGELLA